MSAPVMKPEDVLAMMQRTMGSVPPAIEKSVPVDPQLILEHARSRSFAMPTEVIGDAEPVFDALLKLPS